MPMPSTHPPLTRRQRRRRYVVRRLRGALLVVAVLAALVLGDHWGLFARRPTSDPVTYDGKTFTVVRVVDGDTIDVDVPDKRRQATRVRLWGVDTPEMARRDRPADHFAREATEFVEALAGNKSVTLHLEPGRRTRDNDDYYRLLAFVILPDGRMLNRVLVETGHAYADPRYPHHLRDEFLRLQDRARQARLGLWQTVTQDDLPYYWRNTLDLDPP